MATAENSLWHVLETCYLNLGEERSLVTLVREDLLLVEYSQFNQHMHERLKEENGTEDMKLILFRVYRSRSQVQPRCTKRIVEMEKNSQAHTDTVSPRVEYPKKEEITVTQLYYPVQLTTTTTTTTSSVVAPANQPMISWPPQFHYRDSNAAAGR